MPRKRQRRATTELIQARVEWHSASLLGVRCGCCGQNLPPLRPASVEDAERLGVRRFDPVIQSGNGWRWDGACLRPTPYHDLQRQRSREAAAAQPHARDTRERLHGGRFSRPQTNANFAPAPVAREIAGATRIECPRCHAENEVATRRAEC